MHARKQYLADIRKEYERADEGGRRRLLDEAQKRTKYNRKYLIRALNRPSGWKLVRGRRRRRRAEYGAAVMTALVRMWEIFEQPCGQRLEVVLKTELDRLRRLGEVRCSDLVAEQLKQISASRLSRIKFAQPASTQPPAMSFDPWNR